MARPDGALIHELQQAVWLSTCGSFHLLTGEQFPRAALVNKLIIVKELTRTKVSPMAFDLRNQIDLEKLLKIRNKITVTAPSDGRQLKVA